MQPYINYSNCFYCGQPIRTPIIRNMTDLPAYQLPYCSEECITRDADSDQIISATIAENLAFISEQQQLAMESEQALLDPKKKATIEKQKEQEEQEYKGFRNGILWVIVGVAVALLLISNLDDPLIGKVLFRRLAVLLGVAGVGALIRFFRG